MCEVNTTEQNAEARRRGYAGLIDESLHDAAQVLTYLRLTQRRLGLILNFGQPILHNGITRVVN
jgi:hypothetical protein